jgi:hypothetical protein
MRGALIWIRFTILNLRSVFTICAGCRYGLTSPYLTYSRVLLYAWVLVWIRFTIPDLRSVFTICAGCRYGLTSPYPTYSRVLLYLCAGADMVKLHHTQLTVSLYYMRGVPIWSDFTILDLQSGSTILMRGCRYDLTSPSSTDSQVLLLYLCAVSPGRGYGLFCSTTVVLHCYSSTGK